MEGLEPGGRPDGHQRLPFDSERQAVHHPEAAWGELPGLIEALLFVSPSPVPIARLSEVLEADEQAVEEALAELANYYRPRSGLRLLRTQGRAQLITAPDAASYIERLLGLDLTSKLSQAAMETLAVVAYRQPLTRAQIEGVRGVNCDGVIRTLTARELIEPVGRLEQPGRPFLYGTTYQFLHYFGLDGLDALPPLSDGQAEDSVGK